MKLTRHSMLVFIFIILITVLVAQPNQAVHSSVSIDNEFETILMPFNPLNTQCVFIDNNLYAVSLIGGRIIIYLYYESEWFELQRLGSEEAAFTTFQVKDINGDQTPEIIAGTNGLGFIFIYKLDDSSQWIEVNSGKYVWAPIANLIIGKFSSNSGAGTDLIVQTQEGLLYFLKISTDSFDLISKSPAPFKLIENAQIIDFDNDGLEEIVVTYRTSGVAVIKLVNNAAVSVWENYPWGKVLAMTYSDWNNDRRNELILATSQKVVYLLTANEKGIDFKLDNFQFDYVAENLIINNNAKKMLTTDSTGKLRTYKYDQKNKKWQEETTLQTGRIIKVMSISDNENDLYLWSANRQLIKYQFKN